MENEPLASIQKALESNSDRQLSLHSHADELDAELAELDKLIEEAELTDEPVVSHGLEVPDAARPASLLPPSTFVQLESSFSDEALKRNKYLEFTTPRPFAPKERQALAKAVEQETKRYEYMVKEGMAPANAPDGGINWTVVAEKVTDATSGSSFRRPEECRVKWLGDLRPGINHGKWSSSEREKLSKIYSKHLNETPGQPVDWVKVAEELGTNRTPIDCMREVPRPETVGFDDDLNERLLEACQIWGSRNWHPVGRYVASFCEENPVGWEQCKRRYATLLDPTLSSKPWSKEDDDRLALGIEIYGQSWTDIAQLFTGRTNDQCRQRWKKISLSYLDSSNWTEEEEQRLCDLVEQHGRKWKIIAKELGGGRMDREVHRRYDELRKENEGEENSSELASSSKLRKAKTTGSALDPRVQQALKDPHPPDNAEAMSADPDSLSKSKSPASSTSAHESESTPVAKAKRKPRPRTVQASQPDKTPEERSDKSSSIRPKPGAKPRKKTAPTNDNTAGPSSKLGEPSTAQLGALATDATPDAPPKKPRGRPRKNPLTSETPVASSKTGSTELAAADEIDHEDEASLPKAPSRKRGRPRKNPVSETVTGSSAHVQEEAVGPVSAQSTMASKLAPRPRGRPRKIPVGKRARSASPDDAVAARSTDDPPAKRAKLDMAATNGEGGGEQVMASPGRSTRSGRIVRTPA